MLMSHFEEPKLSDDEEPPTEQDKRKKMVRLPHTDAWHEAVRRRAKVDELQNGTKWTTRKPTKNWHKLTVNTTWVQTRPSGSLTIPNAENCSWSVTGVYVFLKKDKKWRYSINIHAHTCSRWVFNPNVSVKSFQWISEPEDREKKLPFPKNSYIEVR